MACNKTAIQKNYRVIQNMKLFFKILRKAENKD